MDWVQSVILGIVQGLTEFLPVSSSGHLVLFQHWLGIKQHSIIFDLAVHLGTVASIITVYFKSIREIFSDLWVSAIKKRQTGGLHLSVLIICASVPTAIIGFGFKDQFESLFSSLLSVSGGFFITACLLFMTRKTGQGQSMESGHKTLDLSQIKKVSLKKAIIIGFAQGLAIAPGVSRSGATIAAALLMGVERRAAALFSFLMSIPVILGASLIQLKDVESWSSDLLITLVLGGVVSYLAGLAGLVMVLKLVRKGRLEVFSYYLWALSAIVALTQLV